MPADASSGVQGTPGVTHRVMNVAGGPLSVYSAGDASAPPVVLLHGAMYDEARFVWDQMFPELAARFRVHAIDLPRHGASRPWQGTLDHARLMDILAEGFAALGLASFQIVGLSMGGGLAIEYATLHPHQVSGMVLFEPGGLGDTVDHQFATWLYLHTPGTKRLLSWRYRNRTPEQLEDLVASLFVGGSRPTAPERLAAIMHDEIAAKREHRDSDLDDWQTGAIGPRRLTWNLLDRLPLIACPTLWLRGADSTMVKQQEMERAVAMTDKPTAPARLVVIPGAGHLLPLERPAAANSHALTFLEAHL